MTGVAVGLLAGCGGGNPGGQTTANAAPAPKASVKLLLSSTANAQLSTYNVTLTGLSLINASGNAVNVLSTTQTAELMHLNGSVEPLATADVPQDTYKSASITLSVAGFSCVALDSSGGIHAATFDPASPANVTVTLPQPITVSSSGQTLLLNLLASGSATFPTCITDTFQGWAATPSFELSAMDLSVQPTNSGNGKVTNLDGQVTAVSSSGGTFNVTAGDGVSWSLATSGSTVFQGISGLSSLAPDMAVDFDADLQGDGTLLATRVEVDDPVTTDLTLWRGPLLLVYAAEPAFSQLAVETRGTLFPSSRALGPWMFNSGNATFRISGALANLPSLPFKATFAATNMVAGQNVHISTHAAQFPYSPNYLPATTITLLPQTVDGTITGISTEGGFTTYTVTLAGYDPFVLLAIQPGQTTLLQTPGNVIVYADSNTQMLNTTAPMVGSVLRFNGLVFNDNGTLRMDCAEVLDGVAL